MKKLGLLLLIACLCLSVGCTPDGKTPAETDPAKTGEQTTLQTTGGTEAPESTQAPTTTAQPSGQPTPSVAVWNGSVATAFAGGSGTASDPYRIENGEQLAFLAKQVNAGTTFVGKYLTLTADIDLGGLAWTPIGNGNRSFEGYFDGGNKTVSRLCVTSAHRYQSGSEVRGVAGLFGSCRNATLCNLKLVNASVTVAKSTSYDRTYAGALVGRFACSSTATLKDLQICDATVSVDQTSTALYAGGCVGYLDNEQSGWLEAERIGCDVTVVGKSNGRTSYLGGAVGYLANKGTAEFTDLASYAEVKMPHQVGENYAGAFAAIDNKSGSVKLTGAFSTLKLNREILSSSSYAYHAYAIVGVAYQSGTCTGSFVCRNLYGCFYPAGATSPICSLYYIPLRLNETGCQGCATLPASHGLSPSVWNLTDSDKPVLK